MKINIALLILGIFFAVMGVPFTLLGVTIWAALGNVIDFGVIGVFGVGIMLVVIGVTMVVKSFKGGEKTRAR
jgi:membrane-bound ClpP family serine protease